MKMAVSVVVLALALCSSVGAQSNFATNQLTTSGIGERSQRALFPNIVGSFHLPIAVPGALPAANLVDNAAARQLQADKSAFPFLSTLPGVGSANFFTVLKPCGLILPHLHQRATEQYLLISGSHQAGVSEENGGRQNITFTVSAGQSFVAPQGLIHFNANQQCTPNVFIQSFNNADPGTLGVTNALSGLRGAAPDVLAAANFSSVAASSFGAFALDQSCLQRCGLPSTGGGLGGLSQEMQIFLGLANATATTPARAPTVAGGPIAG